MTRILASTLTALTASLALLLGGCASLAPTSASSPPIVAVDAWGGQSLAVPAPELTQRIRRITVHHQGEVWPAAQRPDDTPTAYLQRLQSWSRLSKRWIDIPYHYVIAPDGRIYATRDPAARGDTNTEYDPSGQCAGHVDGQFRGAAAHRGAVGRHHRLAGVAGAPAWADGRGHRLAPGLQPPDGLPRRCAVRAAAGAARSRAKALALT
jgi:hypothetical protein